MSKNIRTFFGKSPSIEESAYIDDSAVIIGDVEIGEDSSVWPQVSIRGDLLKISIGERSNVQDCSTLHTTEYPKGSGEGFDLQIGNDVTIGHGVVLHGCHIKDRTLVGMGAIILDGAVVEEEVFIGAGSLVPPGKILESGYMYVGSPVKKIRPITDKERDIMQGNTAHYVVTKNRYKENS